MASGSRTKENITSHDLSTELPYEYLEKITNKFSDDQKISGNQFGTLYKGTVSAGGKGITVKKILETAPMEAGKTFSNEVRHAMALRHENIVQIVGYCSKTSKKLVQIDTKYIREYTTENFICYEYLPNGSLQENIFGTKATKVPYSKKEWNLGFKIIKGICQGVRFLHKLDLPIIHMDLKPENILLDANMVPKIADFALSRVFGQKQTQVWTRTVVGSYGYMAPEYIYDGAISSQLDIYSLGLMILEITTRKQNCPEEDQLSARKYIEKVQKTWTMEHIASMYKSLDSQGIQQVKLCIKIGLDCVKIDRKVRPPMEKIVDSLNGIR